MTELRRRLETLWCSLRCWVVLVACFWFKAFGTAATFSYGVFMVQFKEEFNLTDSSAALPGAVQQCVRFAAGIPADMLLDHMNGSLIAVIGTISLILGLLSCALVPAFGYLYITFGVIAGFGAGVLNFLCALVAVRHFPDRPTMAFGVVVSGMELGLMTGGPITEILINNLQSWRKTFIVFAIMAFTNLLCCPFMSNPKLDKKGTNNRAVKSVEDTDTSSDSNVGETKQLMQKENHSRTKQIKNKIRHLTFTLCNAQFLCLGLFTIGIDIGYGVPYTFLPSLTTTLGFSVTESAWVLTTFGLSGLMFRLIYLLFGEVNFSISSVLTFVFLFLMGVASMFVPLCTTFLLLIIYDVAVGICLAYVRPMQLVIAVELNQEKKGEAIAGLGVSSVVSYIFSTPFAGWLVQITGQVTSVFLFSGVAAMTGSIFVLFAVLRRKFFQR